MGVDTDGPLPERADEASPTTRARLWQRAAVEHLPNLCDPVELNRLMTRVSVRINELGRQQ
jgi:hypothetical protein